MQDWLPDRSRQCRHLVDVFQWIAELYKFGEVRHRQGAFVVAV